MSDFQVKSFEQTRTDYLRTYRELMIRAGVPDPDVSPGTAIYVRATGIAQECSSLGFNLAILAQDVLPDTAQGNELLRHAGLVGLSLRPAGGSTGPAVFATTGGATAIATGLQLIDPAGLKYKISVGGTYSNGNALPIESIDKGTTTNLAEGTVLRWTTAPPFASQTALVGLGGLTGAVDAENLEGLRVRVLDTWRAPVDGDNAAQFAKWAEESSPAVQKGFCWPCYNGPATAAVGVVRAPTATDKNRDVDGATITTAVIPYLIGKLGEFAETPVFSVTNQATVVSFGLSLPAYSTGLGWVNETPWPTYAANGYADVTSVSSSTHFEMHADTPPSPGVTQICWLSPLDWKLYTGTVQSISGSGPYMVNVDKPFLGIATGHLVMPPAVNTSVYVAAVLTQFANLGPGEKTALAGLLPRALRQPLASQSWPSSIGPSVLKFLSNTGPEVLDVSYLYRSATTPTVPTLASDPPNILVPAGIGFYPL